MGTRGGSRAGKDFTKTGKQEVIDANKNKNAGQTICEDCGVNTIPAQDIPPNVKYSKIISYLNRGEREGKWEYEEACISTVHTQEPPLGHSVIDE